MAFGVLPVLQGSSTQMVTVNIYGTDPTFFNSVSIGVNPTEYSVASNNCTGAIAGPSMCSITVRFDPEGGGRRTGTLVISDTSGTQTAKLTGLGAAVQVSPNTLAFSSTTLGTSSTAQALTLAVVGNTGVTFGTITIGGNNPSDFSIYSDTCSAKTISGGAACEIQVVFRPAATGTRSAKLLIPNDGGPSPLQVSLSGQGSL